MCISVVEWARGRETRAQERGIVLIAVCLQIQEELMLLRQLSKS